MGNYEEEIDNTSGNIKKIHYLSGGAILVNDNGVEALYYGYSDYQGSLITLSDEEGIVVERYAYDPWGARRNPANWTQSDSRSSWITNRGYTGHEHLDAFGIINMNGRVYDPLTAMFFSPDPYVQAPGDWLNYNRYSYVLNNPLKYTDPSGNFYVLPSVSWSYYGGLSVVISAGVGLPSGLSVGAGVNFGFKNNNWTFTANTSLAGFYAYGGYDTKAGWIGGAGFGLSPAFTGNFSVSSNLFNVGFNYSQNGGWSASALGFSYSNQGLIFDPSITVSYSLNWYSYTHFEEFESGENIPSGEFQYSDNDIKDIMAEQGIYFSDFGLITVSAWKDFEGFTKFEGKRYYAFRGDDGIIQMIPENGGKRTIIRGFTKIVGNPWSSETEIYMSRITDNTQFFKTLNHELIHAYHYHIGLHLSLQEKFNQYTEYIAYKYSVSVGSQPLSSLKKWGAIPYTEQVMPPALLCIP